jgi:hypothetical protein
MNKRKSFSTSFVPVGMHSGGNVRYEETQEAVGVRIRPGVPIRLHLIGRIQIRPNDEANLRDDIDEANL